MQNTHCSKSRSRAAGGSRPLLSQRRLALARFDKRPPLGQLPRTLSRDMRAFFGTYTKACKRADALLFQAGNAAAVDEACQALLSASSCRTTLRPSHALDTLEPLLRIYEGCGRAYLGDVEGANVIKIHRRSGKLSYLVYPEFDDDPHPALLRSIRVNLRTRQIDGTDYAQTPTRLCCTAKSRSWPPIIRCTPSSPA